MSNNLYFDSEEEAIHMLRLMQAVVLANYPKAKGWYSTKEEEPTEEEQLTKIEELAREYVAKAIEKLKEIKQSDPKEQG